MPKYLIAFTLKERDYYDDFFEKLGMLGELIEDEFLEGIVFFKSDLLPQQVTDVLADAIGSEDDGFIISLIPAEPMYSGVFSRNTADWIEDKVE